MEIEMKITVEIKTCRNCRHLDHSGAFTVRGARLICSHSDACQKRVSKEAFLAEYPEYTDRFHPNNIRKYEGDWKYHWIHRVVTKSSKEEPTEIPDWCPLKHGAGY
jgi:hypothetical protein